MTEKICWRFPPLSGGTKQGFNNNDIEAFKGERIIDNLAREICQNSLDARSATSQEAVRVSFKLEYVDRSRFPLFNQYAKFIENCKRYYEDNMGHQLKHFLESAKLMLEQDQIPLLIISDYNTSGLKGSRTCNIEDPWEALTSADGISAGKEEGSGGSYGIGKNAPFACSAMRMVFYNTLDENNESAFIGVGRLATFYDEILGDDTQRVGRYQYNDTDNNKYLPVYPENSDDFRDLFAREEGKIGTDVIVAGFAYTENWASNVEKAVIKNFFVAIAENALTVDIEANGEKIEINAGSLPGILEKLKSESDMQDTIRLYEAYANYDTLKDLTIETEGDVEVRVISRPNIGKRIANFRNTGMLINTYYHRLWQNYACIVLVREKSLSDLLKKTEPAKHDNWDANRIQGETPEARAEKKRAGKAIKAIRQQVLEMLRELYESAPEDTVDAAGVGDYLPDSDARAAEEGPGDDALRPLIKVSKIKLAKTPSSDAIETKDQGEKGIGASASGEIHNQTTAPLAEGPLSITPEVNPTLSGNTEGVQKGSGAKRVISRANFKKRTFAISPKAGLYRSIITASKDLAAAYIEYRVQGEDGHNELLRPLKCICNGKPIPLKRGKIGPVSFQKDVPQELVVTFDEKEKMLVDIKISEVSE